MFPASGLEEHLAVCYGQRGHLAGVFNQRERGSLAGRTHHHFTKEEIKEINTGISMFLFVLSPVIDMPTCWVTRRARAHTLKPAHDLSSLLAVLMLISRALSGCAMDGAFTRFVSGNPLSSSGRVGREVLYCFSGESELHSSSPCLRPAQASVHHRSRACIAGQRCRDLLRSS